MKFTEGHIMKSLIGALAIAFAGVGSAQAATTLFSDNFDSEALGLSTALDNWTVTDGTVDVIGPGLFDIYPGNGNYLDLDGSTGNGARIETAAFAFTKGQSYTLNFKLGGNNGSPQAINFGFADFLGSLVPPAMGTLQDLTFTFTALSSGMSTLFFEDTGNDNQGAILDNIVLTAGDAPATVPVPAGGVLLVSALGLLGALRRRAA